MPTTAITEVSPDVANVVLRALKMVAVASRGLSASESELLAAAASVFRVELQEDLLAPIDPAAAGEVLADEVGRTRLVEVMMLMALMDQTIDPEELAVIDRFVPVLGDDYLGLYTGAFDPKRAARAYERGLATKVDITEWDFWPHVGRQIAEVREELGIPSPNS